MKRPYREHLKSYNDLVTSYEATRTGFIEIALEKNRKATPFIEEAKALRVLARKAKCPEDLHKIPQIQNSLLTAAGLSDKALTHLEKRHKEEAISNLVENFLVPAGKKFVDELVYRFLLTRGDTLGGMMRNIAGTLGERKFIRNLIALLSLQKIEYMWFHNKSLSWIPTSIDDTDIERVLKGISWQNKHGNRVLLFNTTVPNVGKNVDLCLLNCQHNDLGDRYSKKKAIISSPELFVALGELKGGIDPAGADEHWKTANSALGRIRKAFSKERLKPCLFFTGAAIEKSMAEEIFDQLRQNALTNAANLTNEEQVCSLCEWLISI